MELFGELCKCASADDSAAKLVHAVPLVMKVIRTRIRHCRPADISLPQFRILTYLRRHGNSTLSAVAEHIGLTLPSMSTAVDRLVKKGLVSRGTNQQDRRRVVLDLTEQGLTLCEAAHTQVQPAIAEMLRELSAEDLETVYRASEIIQRLFSSDS